MKLCLFFSAYGCLIYLESILRIEVNAVSLYPNHQVARPCIPCQGMCSERICDQTCASDQYQLVHITVDGLDLKTEVDVDAFGNVTLPEPYYLVVKAYAGK